MNKVTELTEMVYKLNKRLENLESKIALQNYKPKFKYGDNVQTKRTFVEFNNQPVTGRVVDVKVQFDPIHDTDRPPRFLITEIVTFDTGEKIGGMSADDLILVEKPEK